MTTWAIFIPWGTGCTPAWGILAKARIQGRNSDSPSPQPSPTKGEGERPKTLDPRSGSGMTDWREASFSFLGVQAARLHEGLV